MENQNKYFEKIKKQLVSLSEKKNKCNESIENITNEYDKKIKDLQSTKSKKLKSDKDKLSGFDTEIKSIIGQATIDKMEDKISEQQLKELLELIK